MFEVKVVSHFVVELNLSQCHHNSHKITSSIIIFQVGTLLCVVFLSCQILV